MYNYEKGDRNLTTRAIDQTIDVVMLFGNLDENLKAVEEHCNVQIVQRDGELIITGDNEPLAEFILQEFIGILSKGEPLDQQKVSYVISLADEGVSYTETRMDKDILCFTHRGKPIKPKTLGQREYAECIRKHDVVFGIGPAGTGKTYLAVAMAISAYKQKQVQKIILTRPAVEAGERLGFLPGDMQEKVDPYLRPLYDALYDILGRDAALKMKEKEFIEVVPLAYMRGRTLDSSFIILDEAQNTTREQMKMFLTRMGFGSKMFITGDVTQIDLPRGRRSGLVEASKILKNVDGIDFCYLKDVDVVRHEMVKKIIGAYDRYYEKNPDELYED
ncbi:MAG: PhoH family protein [Clostridia bacterium]|nr:PhoH family protein [Clostridia bacterium]